MQIWAAAKNRYTWSVWDQKQVQSTIKSKPHPTSPAVGPKRIVPVLGVPVFGRITPRYTRVYLLCLTLNCFLSFFSQPESLLSCTLCPPYECRRAGSPTTPPPPTPRHTSNERICLHTSAETQIRHTDTN